MKTYEMIRLAHKNWGKYKGTFNGKPIGVVEWDEKQDELLWDCGAGLARTIVISSHFMCYDWQEVKQTVGMDKAFEYMRGNVYKNTRLDGKTYRLDENGYLEYLTEGEIGWLYAYINLCMYDSEEWELL